MIKKYQCKKSNKICGRKIWSLFFIQNAVYISLVFDNVIGLVMSPPEGDNKTQRRLCEICDCRP